MISTAVSASNLTTSIAILTQSIEFVKEEVEIVRRSPKTSPLDRFALVMEVFISESDPAMVALHTMSQQLDQDLGDLLRYFGEDPSATKVEDFFGMIANFSIALQVILLVYFSGHSQANTCLTDSQKADDEIRDAERLANKGVKASKVSG